MEIRFEGSVAELAAAAAVIRGEVIDDATITKLHSLNQTLRTDVGALATALEPGKPS